MVNPVVFAARNARSAVVLATALAMLLPLPARCASCSMGEANCPRCAAAKTDSHSSRHVPGTCCQRPATADNSPGADVATTSLQHDPSTCGCGVRPIQRAVRPEEKIMPSAEMIAGLAPAVLAPADLPTDDAFASPFALADLPPLIPHRILHCSWVI